MQPMTRHAFAAGGTAATWALGPGAKALGPGSARFCCQGEPLVESWQRFSRLLEAELTRHTQGGSLASEHRRVKSAGSRLPSRVGHNWKTGTWYRERVAGPFQLGVGVGRAFPTRGDSRGCLDALVFVTECP